MKFLPVSLALLGGLLPLPGQEKTEPQLNVEIPDPIEEEIQSEPALDLPDDIAADASLGKRTFIPNALEVLPFTPPPPPVVKRLPAVRVDAAVTHLSKNSRTLTLQRGEASTEPDLPPPPPAPPYVEPHEPTPEEVAQRIWQQRHDLNLGATIYDHRISVVNWTDQETLVRYEAVCGFDIGLLAGVGGFIHNGEDYGLFLMHSDFDTTWERRLTKDWQLEVPEVAPGEILITRGDMKDIAATARMTVVKEIIAAETPRLLAYQTARATYIAASSAWHAAHPPIPRDETFILRPHRGSRYLPGAKSITPARP
jgi:hypothetical protein